MKTYKIAAVTAATVITWHISAQLYTNMVEYCVAAIHSQYQSSIESLANRYGFKRPEPALESQTIHDLVERSALRYKINPSLFAALIHVESGHDVTAVSHAGAIGPAQVMPFNAKRCGLKSPVELFDPSRNLDCGARILSEELNRYRGNLTEALQSYNGGPKCVFRCDESINYSRKVLSKLARDIGPATVRVTERHPTDSDRQQLTTLINKLGNGKQG